MNFSFSDFGAGRKNDLMNRGSVGECKSTFVDSAGEAKRRGID